MKQVTFGLALILAVLLLGTTNAVAQDPIYVTVSGAGAEDGSSWDDAFGEGDLPAAVILAGETGREVWVAGGTYDPGARLEWVAGAHAYGGFSVGDTELDQRDYVANETVISALSYESYVIHMDFRSIEVGDSRIDGFTLADGRGSGGGGRILGADGTVTFANCRVINGDGAQGAGFEITAESTDVVVENCIFENNAGEITSWWYGGALLVNSGSSAIITDCTFTNNTAGIGILGVRRGANSVIRGCTFISNEAWRGGGIYIEGNDTQISDCTFVDNFGDNAGGGIRINRIEVEEVWFDASPTIVNSVFYGNSSADGGGIMTTTGATPIIVNSTFANNTATRGGGIYNSGDTAATIINSILWGNDIGEGTDGPQIRGTSATVSYSNIEGGYAGPGDNNIDADPLFVDAAAGDLRLQEGSPAIDAGDASVAPDADILGTPRPQGAGVDMGAYEFVSGEMVVVPDLVIEGWTLEDVQAALTAAGLNVGTVSQVYSNDVPEGQVISQEPDAGSELPEGSTVNLVISRGPAPAEMPLSALTVLVMIMAVMAAALGSKTLLHRVK